MTISHSKCDCCETEYNSNNAMALMAKHCKKTGHTAFVNCGYGVDGK
jgi:hypothetical protein